jgi:hypothetical protein
MLGRRRVILMNPAWLATMAQANQLIADGQAAKAAQMLDQLAQEVESRGRPRPAAIFHAQAAHAYAASKNEPAALAQARVALDQFIQLNMARRVSRFYDNIVSKLRANGMASAAGMLKQEYGDKVKPFRSYAPASPAQGKRLPSNCPHCGAAARSDEVDWIDGQSAECNYCGGVIQTEG